MKEESKDDSGRRIVVTSQIFTLLTNEVQSIKLKGPHYKVNEARLATAMVEIFFKHYLEKERKKIEDLFLDKKTYLKTLIEGSASEEDLSLSIKKYLKVSKTKRKTSLKAAGDVGEGA